MLKDFMTRVFNAELTEGEHLSTLKSWEYQAHETDPKNDYLRMTFITENCGKQQEFVRNLFERDVSIAVSHLRRQLGRTNEDITPNAFFDGLIADATPFKIWVSYPTVATKKGMQRRQNIHFLAPSVADEADGIEMEVPV